MSLYFEYHAHLIYNRFGYMIPGPLGIKLTWQRLDQLSQEARRESIELYRQELSDLDVKENTLKKQKDVLEAFANRIINFKSSPQVCIK